MFRPVSESLAKLAGSEPFTLECPGAWWLHDTPSPRLGQAIVECSPEILLFVYSFTHATNIHEGPPVCQQAAGLAMQACT